jgi:hypothetical protein
VTCRHPAPSSKATIAFGEETLDEPKTSPAGGAAAGISPVGPCGRPG